MRQLATRIGKDGLLRVISQQTSSQSANKELVVERYLELMRDALRQAAIRKKTRVSRAAKERRMEEKKLRSSIKRERSGRLSFDE